VNDRERRATDAPADEMKLEIDLDEDFVEATVLTPANGVTLTWNLFHLCAGSFFLWILKLVSLVVCNTKSALVSLAVPVQRGAFSCGHYFT